MPVNYMQVMGLIGSISARHPQTVSLGMQTYNLYNQESADLNKANDEYNHSSLQAHGVMDQAGILMELAALHPKIVPLLTQILSMWQTRIPDLIQVLNEFQAASVEAAKQGG